jgi:ERF superfamily
VENLIKALCAARAEFAQIKKEKTNPHFKSKYADLDAVIAATQPALSKNGLAIISMPMIASEASCLITRLYHVSGESIECSYSIPQGLKPQEIGSALTYARRYTLCALLNVTAEDDDDANSAGDRTLPKAQPAKTTGTITEKQITRMMAIAQKAGYTEAAIKAVVNQAGFASRKDIPFGKVYDDICATLGTEDSAIVAGWNEFAATADGQALGV